MVNYGRSKACLTCKKRRVKCDMTQPSCQRCTRIGKTCPGYVDDWDLALRNENVVISSKVPGILAASMSPGASPSSDLESWVIKVFYRDYVLEPWGGYVEWLSFLPEMYEQASEGSILRLSMRAAAFANYAQRTGRKDIEILAIAAYNHALNIAGTVLTTCSQVPTERTMTAVFLLGLYENITSKVVESPRQYHSIGLGAMADLRGELLREGNGPGLLEIVCCQMQRRNLDLEVHPTPADMRLVGLLDSKCLSSQAIINCHDVSKFVATTKEYLMNENISAEWYNSLHLQTSELEQRFETWDTDASAALSFLKVETCGVSASSSMSREIMFEAYLPRLTSLWDKSRASRILMHEKVLEALATTTNDKFPDNDKYRLISLSTIRNLVVNILDSIPIALNYGPSLCSPSAPRSLGGYFVIWPLQVVLRCPYANGAQRMQARKSLEKVGLECGLSYAVVYARSIGIEDEQHPSS